MATITITIDARKARQLLSAMDAEIASWDKPPAIFGEESRKFAADTREYICVVNELARFWNHSGDPVRFAVLWRGQVERKIQWLSSTAPFEPYNFTAHKSWTVELVLRLFAELHTDIAWRVTQCKKEGTWDG